MKFRKKKILAFALEMRLRVPDTESLAVRDGAVTLRHLWVTAIENQETLPGDVSCTKSLQPVCQMLTQLEEWGLRPRNG